VTARNAYLQRLRSSSRRERREALVSRRTPPTVTSFDTQVVDADLARRLLAALSPDQRAAFVLRYVDDLPVREIAGLMGRSARAVESLLVRANARMQAGAAVGGGR
jgi:RNA polymerase sigma-70 factor (ECF subfamily)